MPYVLLSFLLIWLVFTPFHLWAKTFRTRLGLLITKTVPTIVIAAFAGYAVMALPNADSYATLVFIALCICALADLMIEIRFEVGGALFFAAHILYLWALLVYRPLTWWSLTVALVCLCGLWFFLSRYRDKLPNKLIKIGVFIYAAALSALLGLSLPLPFLAFSRRALLAALGAALFVASDMTLCRNLLSRVEVKDHYISLGIYYTGQLLLALSAFPAI